MKVEPRGKYGGVKVHLDSDECEMVMSSDSKIDLTNFAQKLGKKIKNLLEDEPDMLKDRTEEQVIAILAKESEKARLQLDEIERGKDWKKVDPSKLKSALLKHAKG